MIEEQKKANLDKFTPGWRDLLYENGKPMFNPETGMMLNEHGERSIFDDIDE